MRKKVRVAVAMSGGVDSSVAAALLKDKGYEVVGLTMQLWPREQLKESERSCCGIGAVEDVRRVAAVLGIPHYVINTREIFEKKVVAPFCQSYLQGTTPNPCIRCNEFVKFDFLLKKARSLKAEYLATGHYAQIRYSEKEKCFQLLQARDKDKDQSYFLYTLTQKQMTHMLFPLGNYKKTEVREMAETLKLPTAKRPESQEICFIPDNDYHRFIRDRLTKDIKRGPIKNSFDGKVLGHHQGLPFYTIGQRKGLGIAYKEPLYVVAMDIKTNTLFVGQEKDVYRRVLEAGGVHYSCCVPHAPFKARAKIRSRHALAVCTVTPLGRNKAKVEFTKGQWAITPGQAVVFYDRNKVLGGGTIENSVPCREK